MSAIVRIGVNAAKEGSRDVGKGFATRSIDLISQGEVDKTLREIDMTQARGVHM